MTIESKFNTFLEQVRARRALKRWDEIAVATGSASLSRLREVRAHARALRRRIDTVIHQADTRLLQPAAGKSTVPRPIGADWTWRPPLWQGEVPLRGIADVQPKQVICEGTTLFHDCRRPELVLRQVRNRTEADRAPFGLRLDVFRFDGSFLSLVLDLPPEARQDLRLRHLIRLDAVIECERPIEIFARLNIRHGPNVEQIVREMPLLEGKRIVEFDLAYTRMNEKRVEQIWMDLIFEGPEMNEVVLRDVTLSRRPRADV